MEQSIIYDEVIARQKSTLDEAQQALIEGFQKAHEVLHSYQNDIDSAKKADMEEHEKAWNAHKKEKEAELRDCEAALQTRDTRLNERENALEKRELEVATREAAVEEREKTAVEEREKASLGSPAAEEVETSGATKKKKKRNKKKKAAGDENEANATTEQGVAWGTSKYRIVYPTPDATPKECTLSVSFCQSPSTTC